MEEKDALDLVQQLTPRLARQKSLLEPFHRYYRGEFPDPYVPYAEAAEFMALLRRARTNWCRKVVDITVRKLDVIGVTSTIDEADAQAMWAVWERSNMGSKQRMTFRSSARYGLGYQVVGRDKATNDTVIRPLSPRSTVHLPDPDNPDIVQAAMHVSAEQGPRGGARPRYWLWTPTEWAVIDPRARRGDKVVDSGEHGLGRPPIVPFRNQPDEEGGYASDLFGLLEIQDRINQTLADRLIAQSFGAFRQLLILGWAPEKEPDPDNPGQMRTKRTLRPAQNRTMFIDQDPKTVQAVQIEAGELAPFIAAVAADVQHMGALSDTPPTDLLGQMANLSADALRAANAAHTAKVERHKADLSDPLEDVFRLVAAYEGLVEDQAVQIAWKDTEPHSESERVDALTKKAALGVPREQLFQEMGYAPEVAADLLAKADAQDRKNAAVQAAAFGIDREPAPAE